jgi:hypothetical protein
MRGFDLPAPALGSTAEGSRVHRRACDHLKHRCGGGSRVPPGRARLSERGRRRRVADLCAAARRGRHSPRRRERPPRAVPDDGRRGGAGRLVEGAGDRGLAHRRPGVGPPHAGDASGRWNARRLPTEACEPTPTGNHAEARRGDRISAQGRPALRAVRRRRVGALGGEERTSPRRAARRRICRETAVAAMGSGPSRR